MEQECFQYYIVNIYCSLAFHDSSCLYPLVPPVPDVFLFFLSSTEAVLCLIEAYCF